MSQAKIKIEPIEGSHKNYRLFLNGEDISKQVYSISFDLNAGELAQVQLGIHSSLKFNGPANVIFEQLEDES